MSAPTLIIGYAIFCAVFFFVVACVVLAWARR